MKTKFTKGEWGFNYGNLVTIGSVSYEFENGFDAKLIAAAPEMYEMLESVSKELYLLIDEVNDQRMSKVNCQTETPPDLHDQETLHLIQLLLAKARGE